MFPMGVRRKKRIREGSSASGRPARQGRNCGKMDAIGHLTFAASAVPNWEGIVMKLTGGQIVARSFKEYGVEYIAGVPGHGIWSLFDAFLEKGSEIPFI